MELRVGDYAYIKNCRKYGIGKITHKITNNNVVIEFNNTDKIVNIGNIVFNSNIIDLIKVGDYVNGYEVMEPKYHYMGNNFIDFDKEIDAGSGYGYQLLEKDIKSIVTKEQFSSMEYKVGE